MVPRRKDGTYVGTTHIRVLRPLQHPSLSDLLFFSPVAEIEASLPDCDVMLVQRDAVPSPEQAQKLLEHCRARKIRLVYEIDDDLLNIPNGNPAQKSLTHAKKAAIRTLLKQSDAVIVSTSPLKERIAEFNSNVFVLPNALDEQLWQPSSIKNLCRSQSDKVKILYMGTRTHDDDLSIVLPALYELKAEYGERLMFNCIGGFATEPPSLVSVLNPPTATYPDFAKWMSQSCECDIAIAPLAESPFNSCKSYLKFLDYGICGFAAVFSDVTPYREIVRNGENGMLVENDPEAWYRKLRYLIERPSFRKRLGEKARDDVLKFHTLRAQAAERREFWMKILDRK